MYKDESGMFTTVSCKFFSANDWKLGFEMIWKGITFIPY
jgi:hypothetical protein